MVSGLLDSGFMKNPSSSASLELTDLSQVDNLGPQYKFVNFGADMSPGSANWYTKID